MSYTKHDRIVSGAEIYAADIKDMDNKIYDHDSDISDLQDSVDVLEPTASASDVGKALKVKTVAGGKVTAYEFGETAIIDNTLTQTGQAADAKKTGDEITGLKSALNNIESTVFSESDLTPTSFTNSYYICGTNNVNLGKAFYNSAYKCTDFISIESYSKIEIDVPYTTDTQPGIAFFATNDVTSVISGYLYKDAGIDSSQSHRSVTYDVPENASYVRISVLKSVEGSFYIKVPLPKTNILENDIEDLNSELENLNSELESVRAFAVSATERRYILDNPFKALIPEFVSHFWCSNITPANLTNNPLVLTISGTIGENHISVDGIVSPTGYDISDINVWTGVVLTEDGISYDVYNIRYDSTTLSLEVYPKLSKTVSNATLASMYLDSGTTYAGLHLTEHGYKAWVDHLYNQNPKHCEVGLFNASFNSRIAANISESPFIKIDSTKQLYLSLYSHSPRIDYLHHFYDKGLMAEFASSYTPYDAKNGLYWETLLDSKPGYLELLVSANATTLELPDGQEIYVDVYIDGTLAKREIITDTIGKRICVDYVNASIGKVEIYSNKWAAVNNASYGFSIYRCTWWINEIDYGTDAKLFPVGSVVAQEFDSWGVFHDGITGRTLHNLINADAGCTVDYTNHSLGNQTTAWGMAYWYQNVKTENPTIAITDFLLNDTNSVNSSAIPDTITGPDGVEYNNKITEEMFVNNSKKLMAFAINNHIQPILMRNTQILYNKFPDALIEAISEMYTE